MIEDIDDGSWDMNRWRRILGQMNGGKEG